MSPIGRGGALTTRLGFRFRFSGASGINQLVQRGALKTIEVGGRRLVFRDEVEKFKPSVGGRPKSKQSEKGKTRPKNSN